MSTFEDLIEEARLEKYLDKHPRLRVCPECGIIYDAFEGDIDKPTCDNCYKEELYE